MKVALWWLLAAASASMATDARAAIDNDVKVALAQACAGIDETASRLRCFDLVFPRQSIPPEDLPTPPDDASGIPDDSTEPVN